MFMISLSHKSIFLKGISSLLIKVILKKEIEFEKLPYLEWYLTSTKSSYAPILFPWAGEEKISQIETKFGNSEYFVQLQLTKKKKLEALRNCSRDQSQIECASKK